MSERAAKPDHHTDRFGIDEGARVDRREDDLRALWRRDVSHARGMALPDLPLQDRLLWMVMDTFESHVNPSSDEFKTNHERMSALVAEYRDRLARVREGGGPKYLQRHREQGKLPVRERIAKLLDPGSPFLELSALAAWDMYEDEAPAAGIVTGIGRVLGPRRADRRQRRHRQGRHLLPHHGQEAPARAGDRARRIACRACISSIPAARSCRCRPRSFPIATTSAASSSIRRACPPSGIPQIAVVMGSCTAGGAYVPAMSDETIIVKNTGTIFLGGPPLVKAATGEEVTAEELGGADVHTRLSGVADYFAEDDDHALHQARTIVSTLQHAQSSCPPT